jgi:catechol 2,3-dioxygenase-like lactoylglutathione lyase family enzyme
LNKYISRISSVEIPVTNLEASVNWYTQILGVHIQHKDEKFAMLTFDSIGVPGIFLCETQDSSRLFFKNTNNEVLHSIIDFYTSDLKGFHQYLLDQGVQVGELNLHAESDFGGFGFRDPDGNLISACNAIQRGQV